MPTVPGLFITGTDTGVGKTYVASLLIKALAAEGRRVGVYKPVASGCSTVHGIAQSEDAVALWQAAGRPGELERVCPQRFVAPLAPHLAARAEGQSVDCDLLRSGLDYWLRRSDIVVVEGVGGLLTPISDEDYVADLAYELGFPLIVVSANRLGAINCTLQTLLTVRTYRGGLPLAGIVLNDVQSGDADPSQQSNAAELQARDSAPLLARVRWQATGWPCVASVFSWAGNRGR